MHCARSLFAAKRRRPFGTIPGLWILSALGLLCSSPLGLGETNLLEGFSTRFEHGCAGWQPFVLPHYPAVAVPAEYHTATPGEGSASLVIRSGNGVNSMPIPAARAESTVTLSFLARAESPHQFVIRFGHSDGTLRDRTVTVGTTWSRYSATYTIDDPDAAPFVFLENRGDGSGPSVFIDAISLDSGTSSDDIPPSREIVLRQTDDGASATLICNGVETGTWPCWQPDVLDAGGIFFDSPNPPSPSTQPVGTPPPESADVSPIRRLYEPEPPVGPIRHAPPATRHPPPATRPPTPVTPYQREGGSDLRHP
jgi:hypothetical protein